MTETLSTNTPAAPPTPREVRHRLNRLESWWQDHETEFTPEQRTAMRGMLEHASDARHLETMQGIVRAWRKQTEAA